MAHNPVSNMTELGLRIRDELQETLDTASWTSFLDELLDTIGWLEAGIAHLDQSNPSDANAVRQLLLNAVILHRNKCRARKLPPLTLTYAFVATLLTPRT